MIIILAIAMGFFFCTVLEKTFILIDEKQEELEDDEDKPLGLKVAKLAIALFLYLVTGLGCLAFVKLFVQ